MINYTQSYIPDKENIFLNYLGHHDQLFRKEFDSVKEKNIDYKDNVLKLLNIINERKINNLYLNKRHNSKILDLKLFGDRLIRIKNNYFIIKWIKYYIFKKTIIPIRKLIWKFFAANKIKNNKYCFYPMHAPAESTSVTNAFPFSDEIALIKNIALSIPSNMTLIVKEHPGYEGWKTIGDLIKLLQIHNVI